MADNLPAPESRVESYLAKAAGEDVTIPEKPLSRTEQYLAAIAEGGGGGGGVTVVQTTGQSTTDVMSQKAVTDSLSDAHMKYLSKSDYDFPTDAPTGIALWNLEEGLYKLTEDSTYIIYNAANPTIYKITRNAGESFLVLKKANGSVYMYDEVDDSQRPRLVWSAKNGTTGGTIATIKDSEITTSLTTTVTGTSVLDGVVGKTLNDRIGDLSTLTTTAKTSAVAAINEIAQGGGGGGGEPVKTLTSDDYDYPVASPQGIALWELDTGVYTVGGSTAIKVYYNSIQSTNADSGASFLVLHHGIKASIYWYDQTLNTPTYIQAQETYGAGSWSDLLQKKSIVDNLLSTNASLALSANQGYVLKGLIDALDARVSALEGN